MDYSIAIIVALFFLLILLFIKIYGHSFSELFSQDEFEYYDYGNLNAQIKVGFIASVHGNEPSGHVGLTELMSTGYFKEFVLKNPNIFIRVIPEPNKWGLKYKIRYQPNIMYPDINRNFVGENGLEPVSQRIIQLTKDLDILVDFHEGWGYHLINKASIGSTISPGNTKISNDIAVNAVNAINNTITDPKKKFVILRKHSCVIPKTLSCSRESKRKNYILVETSGQNDIQPINIRSYQVKIVVMETLKYVVGTTAMVQI